MKQYPNYESVEDKYKWDIEAILDGKSFDSLLKEYEELMMLSVEIKDSKYESLENFIEGLKLGEKIGIISNKLSNYISNKSNINLVDSQIQELGLKFDNINEKINNLMGSETNRIFANKDKILLWINDKRLFTYRRGLLDIIDSFKYKLSDQVEEFISKSAFGEINLEEIFSIITDSEQKYDKVCDSKKRKHNLDPISFNRLVKLNDAYLRKNAVLKYKNAKLQHKESLASMLVQNFKNISVNSKIRGFKSSIDALIYEDKINQEVLKNLFFNVSNTKNTISKYRKKYKYAYEKRFKEKYRPKYDSYRNIVKIKNTFTVEEAKNIVLEALKPLGKDYIDQVKKAFNEKWIDFMSVKNKLSGAYSIGGTYGIEKKYILLNFDGELDSINALAHELGHSMHSYYSDKNNDYHNASYPIILAEIASIFNEILLNDYLIKNAKNDKEKFYILSQSIDNFIGTVITQTMWANYEYNLYNKIDDNMVAPNYDSVAKIYYDTMKPYFKKIKKYNKDDQIASVTIPHFYMGFYVYKYAIGYLVACYFYSMYKKTGVNYLEKYIEMFLSAGGSDYPLEILKKMDIDLMSNAFYDNAFDYLNSQVNEWSKIVDKIFKK
ncbi:oligoendopeptidase F [Mycoplasma tauri]|uniref:oligoendopeptidase F n=2 Tax=Mycoplasma tauri TaxID=547987 RepID=UPI001CBF9886|nr:oligoendopeptidase F [Mycoplasma tauri]MBZ4204059.1 oligoendopeptidase F [Mycoplasma tauri]